jgi:hypothetical protein
VRKNRLHIDGWLYFGNAVGAAFLTYISSEEAYKYINPLVLFWLKAGVGSMMAGFNGIKAYRSMAFARHVEQDKKEKEKVQL